jgi:two-component system response regulator HydG
MRHPAIYRVLVPVKGRSGETYLVLKSHLEQLIKKGEIQQFSRSEGQLDVDEDQRKREKAGYTGPERRACKIVDFSLFPLSIEEQLQRTRSAEAILGYGQKAQEIAAKLRSVANTNLSVLIHGNTGTGKGIVALMLHEMSKRKDKPFIKMDCGAIPPALISNELFGYKKGSCTGAFQSKLGRLRLADGGTIFLDEIASLNPDLQRSLVGFLEERVISSPDGGSPIRLDVRVVSATNANLPDQVRDGHFREDLFYRLNEFEIEMPPLRERADDLFYLATRFLCMANAEFDTSVFGFSAAAIDYLSKCDWRGNIRELKNLITRATLFAGEVIEVEHLVYC